MRHDVQQVVDVRVVLPSEQERLFVVLDDAHFEWLCGDAFELQLYVLDLGAADEEWHVVCRLSGAGRIAGAIGRPDRAYFPAGPGNSAVLKIHRRPYRGSDRPAGRAYARKAHSQAKKKAPNHLI